MLDAEGQCKEDSGDICDVWFRVVDGVEPNPDAIGQKLGYYDIRNDDPKDRNIWARRCDEKCGAAGGISDPLELEINGQTRRWAKYSHYPVLSPMRSC